MSHPSDFSVSVFRVKPQDFSPSVEVAACYVEFNGKFLFLKRSVGKPQENTWGVPAGKIEKGETPRQAVFRETFEEVGIRLDEGKVGDVEIKKYLANVLNNFLEPIRKKRKEYQKDPMVVEMILTEGRKKTQKEAKAVLQEVKKAMGIV